MEKNSHKYPIGVQGFEKLRKDGYVYIDKTKHLYNLINEGNCYFLSRPRRFGKSLFLSTLQEYFSGKKELFEGTFIATKEKEWLKYPVMKLDLNAEQYNTPEKLEGVLNDFLCKQEEIYGTRASETSFGLRFQGIIKRASEMTNMRVVILIDEYDKPLLQAIGNPELQDAYRGILKGFYGVLKSMDDCIKFAFLTGVTRFSKISVFSDLRKNCSILSAMPLTDWLRKNKSLAKTASTNYEKDTTATTSRKAVRVCIIPLAYSTLLQRMSLAAIGLLPAHLPISSNFSSNTTGIYTTWSLPMPQPMN